jgi:hypothetical protein
MSRIIIIIVVVIIIIIILLLFSVLFTSCSTPGSH